MKKFLLTLLLVIMAETALAELSSNPWAVANEQEDVKKVYERRNRRGKTNQAPARYQTEQTTEIDRTHAYIQDEEELGQDEDKGFLDKVKSSFSSKPKQEKPLIMNTAENRKKLAQQKKQQQEAKKEEESNSLVPSFGMEGLTKSMKMPNVNAGGMIQKLKKASRIDFKSIAKQFK